MTRDEGESPVTAVCSAPMTVMAAREKQGGQHGQQRKISHGLLTCWRICLSVSVAGLAGTARSVVVPDTVDQQASRKFAVQPVGLVQLRLQSGDPVQ